MGNDNICLDSFLVNTLGDIDCTFKLRDRSSITAPYGITTIRRVLTLVPGTHIDAMSPDLGFSMVLDPSADSDSFPAGVEIRGSFSEVDVSGSPTDEKEVVFTGEIEVDRDEYVGGFESVKVSFVFNPGGSDS